MWSGPAAVDLRVQLQKEPTCCISRSMCRNRVQNEHRSGWALGMTHETLRKMRVTVHRLTCPVLRGVVGIYEVLFLNPTPLVLCSFT